MQPTAAACCLWALSSPSSTALFVDAGFAISFCEEGEGSLAGWWLGAGSWLLSAESSMLGTSPPRGSDSSSAALCCPKDGGHNHCLDVPW